MPNWVTQQDDLRDQIDRFINDISIKGYSHSLFKTQATFFRDIPLSDMNLWSDVSVLISEKPDLSSSKAIWDYKKSELIFSSKVRNAIVSTLSYELKIHSTHIRYAIHQKPLPQFFALRWLPFKMIEKHALLYMQDTPEETDKQKRKE